MTNSLNSQPRPRTRRWRRWAGGLLMIALTQLPNIGGINSSLAVAQDAWVLSNARIETLGPAGVIEAGQILIQDGKIVEVGATVKIPPRAQVVDLEGKTILPGFVDPYFVVNFPLGGDAPEEPRTVTFGGRTFTVPGNRGPATPTGFIKIADQFDPRRGDWEAAFRSGITSVNIVTAGQGQAAVSAPFTRTARDNAWQTPAGAAAVVQSLRHPTAGIFTTLSNDAASVKIVRDGLKGPPAPRGGPESGGPSDAGANRSRGSSSRGRGSETPAPSTDSRSGSPTPPTAPATPDPVAALWQTVREGKTPLIVNANNAAAMLYLIKEAAAAPAARIGVVGNGAEWFSLSQTWQSPPQVSAILPPRWETVPGNQVRLNPAAILETAGVPVIFSLSSASSEYRTQAHSPLFSVGLLVKSGLNRQTALEALTVRPAKLLGIEAEVGSLEVGKRADLVIWDSEPFSGTAAVEQVWIEGKPVWGLKETK